MLISHVLLLRRNICLVMPLFKTYASVLQNSESSNFDTNKLITKIYSISPRVLKSCFIRKSHLGSEWEHHLNKLLKYVFLIFIGQIVHNDLIKAVNFCRWISRGTEKWRCGGSQKERQNETKANFFVAFFLNKKRKKLEKL